MKKEYIILNILIFIICWLFLLVNNNKYFLNAEPGYYKENHFGVRLETILEVITRVII